MNDALQPVLVLIGHKAAWVAGLLPTVMVVSRLVMKWFSGPLQAKLTERLAMAANSPDAQEQRDWETLLRQRWYRVLNFSLDLVLSVKLPVLADFLRAKGHQQEKQQPTNQGEKT